MEAQLLSDYFEKSLTSEFLDSVPEDLRRNLIMQAQALSDIAAVGEPQLRSPTLKLFNRLTQKHKIRTSREAMSKLAAEDEFELWSLDGKFMGSSNRFF